MSGIAGVYHLDGRPLDRVQVQEMLARLAHRGPDGMGMWHEGAIGLGHCMLWTTPESLQERLPLANQSGAVVLTADARLDNREALLATLGRVPCLAENCSDSALILAAYEKWGPSCPEKLLGDFAFAIWDGRRQVVFCARDIMGIKPFYYYYTPGILVFASELQAMLGVPEVPCRLNEVKVADFLIPTFHDHSSTYYQDIVRLPPAHTMTIGPGGLQLRSYWRPDPSRELRLGTDEDYVEAFRDLFTEAVRCRLRSAFPVGSTLSGGLDSSTIACTAAPLLRAQGGQRLQTFSAIFPSVAAEDPRIDERPFIAAVLATGHFDPHEVRADCCQPLSDVALHPDEVLAAPNWYMVTPLLRAAQEHGVRVLLSGVDGDVTVSYGYEYLDELAGAGRWADFAREAHDLAQHWSGSPMYYLRHHGLPHVTTLVRRLRWWAFVQQASAVAAHFRLSRRQLFLDTGFKPFLPECLRRGGWPFSGRTSPSAPAWGRHSAIHPAFAQRIGLAKRLQASAAAPQSGSGRHLRDQHALALVSGDLQYILGRFDQAAGRRTLEQRYPFFDQRLIEFCLALPLEQKLRHGWTRAILRRAMQNILPPAVQWRTDKGNMSVNIRRRLWAERATLEAVIVHDPGLIKAYVDMPTLQAAYHRFLAQPVPSTEEDLFTIYLAVTLSLWLRQSQVDEHR